MTAKAYASELYLGQCICFASGRLIYESNFFITADIKKFQAASRLGCLKRDIILNT